MFFLNFNILCILVYCIIFSILELRKYILYVYHFELYDYFYINKSVIKFHIHFYYRESHLINTSLFLLKFSDIDTKYIYIKDVSAKDLFKLWNIFAKITNLYLRIKKNTMPIIILRYKFFYFIYIFYYIESHLIYTSLFLLKYWDIKTKKKYKNISAKLIKALKNLS